MNLELEHTVLFEYIGKVSTLDKSPFLPQFFMALIRDRHPLHINSLPSSYSLCSKSIQTVQFKADLDGSSGKRRLTHVQSQPMTII